LENSNQHKRIDLDLKNSNLILIAILWKEHYYAKIGVLGAGHLGKIHLRLLQQSEKYELVGFTIQIKRMLIK
jgi:hypothetical protein